MAVNDFEHLFKAGKNEFGTLLMLHGTGGNEHDMVNLAEMIAPEYGILSPQGKVQEFGMQRYFRRFREGDIDILDYIHRTHELANWLNECLTHYEIDRELLTAVGYSNGANMAAGLLLMRPEVISNAILYHPMYIYTPEELPNLSGKRVYIGAGQLDDIAEPDSTAKLSTLLKGCRADITLRWFESGHELSTKEIADSKDWLSTALLI